MIRARTLLALAALAAAAPAQARMPPPDPLLQKAQDEAVKELGAGPANVRNLRKGADYVCGEIQGAKQPRFERFLYSRQRSDVIFDDGKLPNMFNFLWTGACPGS